MGILAELFSMPAPGQAGVDRLLPQTERARYSRAKYAEGERWITLNGDSGDDGNGGTPVKIDGEGAIVAGPSGLASKGIKHLDDFGGGKKKEPQKPAKPARTPMPPAPADADDENSITLGEPPAPPELATKIGPKKAPQLAGGPQHHNDFHKSFQATFDELRNKRGGDNLVFISDLRKAHPELSPEEFKTQVDELRRAGFFSGDSSDGNHVRLTDEQREGGFKEGGSNLVYLSEKERAGAPFQRGAAPTSPSPVASAAAPAPSPASEFHPKFESAFDQLNSNGRNMVLVSDLRKQFPEMSREQFDGEVRKLRESGHFTADSYDGTSRKLTEEQRLGGIKEGPNHLVYLGKKARYAKKDEESDRRWITINGGEGGGTPVQIDGEGKILKGPSSLAKQGVKSLDDFGKKGKGEAKPKKQDADAKARSKGFKDEDDQKRFEDAAKRHEDGVSQEAGFKDSDDEKRFEQSLKPAGKSDWLKSLPRFQRQMVEELWDKHLEKNPKASRADFEESLRGDSRKANQKPKPEKPARQPAKKPSKPKPKKDPQDNLWPYVGLDRTPEPEPTYTEMTEFEDDAPAAKPAPVSTGTSDDRRLGLKLGDLDKQLENIGADAQAEKARRKAAKQSLFQAFQTMVSGWMKPADDTDYGPGAMGVFRRLVAKSLHSKDAGEREKYQRQAFKRFIGDVEKYRDARGDSKSRWITIGQGEEGGAKVQIDGKGNILKGPGGLADKGITNLKHFDKTTREIDNAPSRASAKDQLTENVKRAAEDWEIEESDLHDALEEVWEEKRQRIGEREKAKESLRKMLGVTAADVQRMDNSGFDHASDSEAFHKQFPTIAKRMGNADVFASELARDYPELELGDPDDDDVVGNMFARIREGKEPPPPKHDQDLVDEAAKLVRDANKWRKENPVYEDDGVIPYSRILSEYRKARYAKDANGMEHGEDGRFGSGGSGKKAKSLFDDHEPTPEKKKVAGEFHDEPKRTQKKMLSGLDSAPGQQDLFDNDGVPEKSARKKAGPVEHDFSNGYTPDHEKRWQEVLAIPAGDRTQAEDEEYDVLEEARSIHHQIKAAEMKASREAALSKDGVKKIKGAEAFRSGEVDGKKYWYHSKKSWSEKYYSFDQGNSWSKSIRDAMDKAKADGKLHEAGGKINSTEEN